MQKWGHKTHNLTVENLHLDSSFKETEYNSLTGLFLSVSMGSLQV